MSDTDPKQLRLKENHTWRCRPGYKICVLDRGTVRFDIPSRWIIEPDRESGALMLHDRKPGIESCDLGVSIFRVPAAEVVGLELEDLLRNSLEKKGDSTWTSEIHSIDRGDLQVRWVEQHYLESTQKRDARFRSAIARGTDCHCLITMNYWSSRATTLEPVWSEVMRTLVLGIYVKDPTVGPIVQ